MQANVRMATLDDLEHLVRARFDFFAEEKRVLPPGQRSVIETSLREYCARQLGGSFFAAFAEEEGRLASVAFLALSEMPPNAQCPTGRKGTLYNVLTYPAYRRRGLATGTLRALIQVARRQHLSCIELSATGAGKNLYERLGFAEQRSPYTQMRLQLP